MSEKQRKSIREIVNNWVTSVIWHMRANNIHKRYIGNFLTFCTLTLSSEQIHCDKTIKRKCLNHFFIYLKRRTKVVNYLWVSEKQKNGNLHFHIILDRFVDWQMIRNLWNDSQEKLEYITRFEKKYGHRNPPSTDIQGLKNIQNPSAYITKYVTKKDSDHFQCGTMWNCTDRLKKIVGFTEMMDSKLSENLSNYVTESMALEYKSDFFSIIQVESGGVEKAMGKDMADKFKNHFSEQFNFLNSAVLNGLPSDASTSGKQPEFGSDEPLKVNMAPYGQLALFTPQTPHLCASHVLIDGG